MVALFCHFSPAFFRGREEEVLCSVELFISVVGFFLLSSYILVQYYGRSRSILVYLSFYTKIMIEVFAARLWLEMREI